VPWFIIAHELNRIFGTWGWDYEVIESHIRFAHEKKSRSGKMNTCVIAHSVVRLTVTNNGATVVKQATGSDHNEGFPEQAYRVAEMGAERIAFKRAANLLGPAFGIMLYGPPSKPVRYPWNGNKPVPPVWGPAMRARMMGGSDPHKDIPEGQGAPVEPPAPMGDDDETPGPVDDGGPGDGSRSPVAPSPDPEPPEDAWGEREPENRTDESPWQVGNRQLHGALGQLAARLNWGPGLRNRAQVLIHWKVCGMKAGAKSITEVDGRKLGIFAARWSELVNENNDAKVKAKLVAWGTEHQQAVGRGEAEQLPDARAYEAALGKAQE